jgi:hypothetical protein
MKWIDELKNDTDRNECLIIGSGASLDHIPYVDICNSFWIDDLIICVNDMWKDDKIKYDYCINHHTVNDLPQGYLELLQEEIYKHPNKHVLPEFDCHDERRGVTQMKGDFYMYKGMPVCESTKVYVKPIVEKIPNTLFVGGSILFDAIGLGLHLGIKKFYLMGFDGGQFEGHSYYSKYRELFPEDPYFVTGHSIRTMNSFKSLQEFLKPRGITFTHISARYGSSDLTHTNYEGLDYSIVL